MYSVRWVKMAALYFVIGSSLGMFMSITHSFTLAPLHAHINLLGWVSMGVFAALYKVFPALETGKLAPWHFWMHQLFFPIFMGALYLIIQANPLGEKIIPFGATPTLLSIIVFGVHVWTTVKQSDASADAMKRGA